MAIKVTTLLSKGLIKEKGPSGRLAITLSVLAGSLGPFYPSKLSKCERSSSVECWLPPGGKVWYCGSWHPNGAKCKKKRKKKL